MKKLMKYMLLAVLTLTLSNVQAQNETPSAGSFGFGISFNPVSGIRANKDFNSGSFVGNAIAAQASNPYQMFILAQEPMVSLKGKYCLSDNLNAKASIGFSGASFNYREYVTDDAAVAANPFSEDVVVDAIDFKMSGGGVSVGVEYVGGEGNLRFVGGLNLLYSWGGAVMNFTYGNNITKLNPNPSCMALISDSLNNFTTNGDIVNGRPTKRYNIGQEKGFGILCDVGIEWFMADNLSLGAALTFAPIMIAKQPQTYTIYEGYSLSSESATQYNKLVSPGSTSFLYGTENLGLSLSLHYYFN